MAKKISIATGNGLEINSENQNLQVKKGSAINTENGVSVKVDNETIKVVDDKLKAVASAPDLTEGDAIDIQQVGTNTTISVLKENGLEVDANNKLNVAIAKGLSFDTNKKLEVLGHNGIGVGDNGVSVNIGNGLAISSNKVVLNANFTQKDTPLGTNPSNIELYSDGKIKVVGGGGSGELFLYATIPYEVLLKKNKTINIQNVSEQYFDIDIEKDLFQIINPIADNEGQDYLYLPILEYGDDLRYGDMATPSITCNGNYIIKTSVSVGTYVVEYQNNSISINRYGIFTFGEFCQYQNLAVTPSLVTMGLHIRFEIYKLSGNITPQEKIWQLVNNVSKNFINIYAIKKPT